MRKVAILLPAVGFVVLLIPFYFQLSRIRAEIRSVLDSHVENISRNESKLQSSWAGSPKKSVNADRRPPRILCWVQTWPGNHMRRAIHVKKTWGSRCDILLFMSSQQDDRLGAVALPGIEDGHNKMWPKTQKAFKYIWEHHREDADWFFRADDDAYVLVDNLRSFLQSYDPKEPHYLGCEASYGPDVVVNLGFSFALSKEALRIFIEDSLPYPEKCYPGIRPTYKGDDDTEFGLCLKSVGILPGNTKDENGRYRFMTLDPVDKMENVYENGRWMEVGKFLAEQAIAFQVKIEHMYVLEYLTHYLKGF